MKSMYILVSFFLLQYVLLKTEHYANICSDLILSQIHLLIKFILISAGFILHFGHILK